LWLEGHLLVTLCQPDTARSKLDAYTETGGGFPATFDEMRDHSTVLRAVVDGVHTLDNNIRLLARAEAAYRIENETAATCGTIIGLSDFSFVGQKTHQFSLRGGLGAWVRKWMSPAAQPP